MLKGALYFQVNNVENSFILRLLTTQAAIWTDELFQNCLPTYFVKDDTSF